MSGTPRPPGLTSADADWPVRTALAVATERGFPRWPSPSSTSPPRSSPSDELTEACP